ncbi:Palmitoyl-acyl carrier protein thioesterase, chloroplastic [Linum perenne]
MNNRNANVKINGVKSATINLDHHKNVALVNETTRQNIPTEKQYVDRHRQGLMIENGVGYRQTVVVRSYEVGPDKTATLDSLLNLLQETALNHVWMSGLLGNGFGATHGMVRNNLIWVVSRMQVEVDDYPIWGEIVDIDTWVGASGKNGMRRDWLIRSQATGQVFARATSTWVMMNEKTRRLSKMPEEVREEISPWFIEKQAIVQQDDSVVDKIVKLDDNAKYVNTNLKPRRGDLDMNHHVNNVKYVKWMLETIPDEFVDEHQLSGIILEYRRECGSSDVVEALCDPDEVEEINILQNGFSSNMMNNGLMNCFTLAAEIMEGNGLLRTLNKAPTRFTHLLRTKLNEKQDYGEIVRGKTTWKKRPPIMED